MEMWSYHLLTKKLKIKKVETKEVSVYLPEWFNYGWWLEFTQKHFYYRFRNKKYYYLTAAVLYRSQNYANKNIGISMPTEAISEKWEISRMTLGRIITALEKDGYIIKVRNHNRYQKIAREWKYNYDLSDLRKIKIISPVWNVYNNDTIKKISYDNSTYKPKYFNYAKNLNNWWFPQSSFNKLNSIDWSLTSDGRERRSQEIIDYKNMIKARMKSWNSGDMNIKISDKCGRLFHTPNEINKKARVLYRFKGNNSKPVEVDINAAHLRIVLATMLDLRLNVENEVINLINDGDIYSFIASNINKDRNDVKFLINSKLINTHKISTRWIVNKFVAERWINFWNSLVYLHDLIKASDDLLISNKMYKTQNLGALCMLIESDLVLNSCDSLSIKHIPVISIHDAILTLPSHVEIVSESLVKNWNDFWCTTSIKLKLTISKQDKIKYNRVKFAARHQQINKITNNILVVPKVQNIEVFSNSPP
jgi:DNA-binding Lrp family transcriptional regulator